MSRRHSGRPRRAGAARPGSPGPDRPAGPPDNRAFLGQLNEIARGLEILPPDQPLIGAAPIRELRRSRRSAAADPWRGLTLVEVDGILRWREGSAGAGEEEPLPGRRRGLRAAAAPETVAARYQRRTIEPNKVGEWIGDLDRKLTPGRGLRRLRNGNLEPVDRPTGDRKILLIVHGTFSHGGQMIDDLRATPDGRAFLKQAEAGREVLVFDHPTLSVSPVLNAVDLARLMGPVGVEVDVIAHSRGGLVARWWLECFGGAGGAAGGAGRVPGAGVARRAVLVGSPLDGTSLAAPDRLRAGLDLLTNFGRALALAGKAASVCAPFLAIPLGLLSVIPAVTGLVAKTPLLDAAVAIVPGLAGQSRVANNPELERLRATAPKKPPRYFAVRSNFEPTDPGWKFWQHFRKLNLADTAADRVFDGANDLVVDTDSMTLSLPGPLPAGDILDFGTNPTVHHCNYFEQPETIRFLRKSLGI